MYALNVVRLQQKDIILYLHHYEERRLFLFVEYAMPKYMM